MKRAVSILGLVLMALVPTSASGQHHRHHYYPQYGYAHRIPVPPRYYYVPPPPAFYYPPPRYVPGPTTIYCSPWQGQLVFAYGRWLCRNG